VWRCSLALEIERRFLVAGEAWRRHSLWQARLRQGYLSQPGEGLTVRIRTSEPLMAEPGIVRAWLTLKAPPPGSGAIPPAGGGDPSSAAPSFAAALTRLEFEYAIPPADAEAMLALTSQQVVKCRHGLNLEGGDWVLDVFEGANAPLVVAEVELTTPEQPVMPPSWCIRELTGLQALSNAALAARPLRQWHEDERRALLADHCA
jgi:CYTH domain-containing protein